MVGCNKWSRSDVTQKTTKYETMKKGILFILALGCFYCNAQEDTTQYKLGNKKLMLITNSDADENPFTFNVSGTSSGVEDITVKGNNTIITVMNTKSKLLLW